jgi:hypothetical protein
MKNLRVIPSLLATFLLVSGAVAQTGGPETDEPSGPSEIAAARSKYLEKAADAAATKDGQAEAQLPRRGPRMPIPPQRRYYGGAYSTPWMANGDAGHALIGAGIGFAIGATIGAAGAVHNGTSVGNGVALGGSLCALFGLAIGATHGLGHPYMYRRRIYAVPPEDDAEGNLRSPAIQKNSPAKLPASRNPGLPSQQREVEANAAGAPEISEGPERPSEGAVSSPKTQH